MSKSNFNQLLKVQSRIESDIQYKWVVFYSIRWVWIEVWCGKGLSNEVMRLNGGYKTSTWDPPGQVLAIIVIKSVLGSQLSVGPFVLQKKCSWVSTKCCTIFVTKQVFLIWVSDWPSLLHCYKTSAWVLTECWTIIVTKQVLRTWPNVGPS